MPVPHHDWIAHHAARRPDAVAAVDLASGRSLGYREFDRRIARLAGHLRDACGIGPGARVAALAQNGTDLLEAQFACFRLGALFVPLNWRLALPELDAIAADCTPAVLVHDAEFADAAEALAGRPGIAHRPARGASAGRPAARGRGPPRGGGRRPPPPPPGPVPPPPPPAPSPPP